MDNFEKNIRMHICVKLSHSAEFCTMLQINYVSIKKGKKAQES